jgi:hypothetical protein
MMKSAADLWKSLRLKIVCFHRRISSHQSRFVHASTDLESLSQAIHQILRSGIFHLASLVGFSRRLARKLKKHV